jgi:uncharacterized protein YndB with AHSA1/START domain
MGSNNKTQVVKDLKEKSILVSREFNAPVTDVWRAFTESDLLDQWWGPAPWRAETKTMNFAVGGFWLYAMIGPENEKHWGRMNYLAIDFLKSYTAEDCFCDEAGAVNPDLPTSKGKNVFTETNTGTKVEFKLIYSTEAHLQKIIEFGFEQGITICFDQLETVFERNKI